ncbi:MAG: hypothetical protein ACP5QG_00280 [candidate division WOR-3 bacterium]
MAFFLLFALLFPLAWANSTVYSEARALAEMKSRLASARREYNLARSRLAEEERLLVIEQRAKSIGMRYPEVMAIDEDKNAGHPAPSLGSRDSLALGMAPVAGRQ